MNLTRLSLAQNALQAAQIDTLALMPGPNLLYLSGIHSHASERPTLMLIPQQGDPAIIMPTLEAPKATAVNIPPHHIFHWGDDEGFHGAFQRAAATLNLAGQTIAVETLYMRFLELETLNQVAPGWQPVAADGLLNHLRLRKDPTEISQMRHAVAVAEAAMKALLPQIKIGQTEKQIAALLSQELLNAGADALSFPPIVSSGPNAASPHAVPTNHPLTAGELLIIDWGAVVNDYPSDLTRTFAVGEVSDELRHIHEVVQAANAAGRAACQPHATCGQVDEAARAVIAAAGYGEYFIHRTGHGLGLEVHEAPSMMGGNDQPLVTGMTFTVEPGIYLPGVGGVRIEDDILMTDTGHESLSSLDRRLQQVG